MNVTKSGTIKPVYDTLSAIKLYLYHCFISS